MTQAKFAKRLGVSTSYIQKIELGKKTPSASLKRRVFHLTGVSPESICAVRGTPRTLSGTEVTGASIEEWQRWRKSGGHEIASLLTLKHAELALRAIAVAAAQRDRGETLFLSFQEWLEKAIADLELKQIFKAKMTELAFHWNQAMKSRGNLLLVAPKPSTAALWDATKVAMWITDLVKAGNASAEKWTPKALQEAFDEELQVSEKAPKNASPLGATSSPRRAGKS